MPQLSNPDGSVSDLSVGGTALFSIDGLETVLAEFSTGNDEESGGDGYQASHWERRYDPLGIMDPTLWYQERAEISALDLQSLDVIGWDLTAAAENMEPVDYEQLLLQAKEQLAAKLGVTVEWIDTHSSVPDSVEVSSAEQNGGETDSSDDNDAYQWWWEDGGGSDNTSWQQLYEWWWEDGGGSDNTSWQQLYEWWWENGGGSDNTSWQELYKWWWEDGGGSDNTWWQKVFFSTNNSQKLTIPILFPPVSSQTITLAKIP